MIMAEPELPVLLVDEVGGIFGVLEAHLPLLKKHFHLLTMKELLENKACLSAKVEAIYVWWCRPVVDRELLKTLPNLKVVATSGVGVDHLDLKLIAGFGVRIANAPWGVRTCTADIGVALLLAAARRLMEGDDVTGATLGIIGMGSIGYQTALRARAFEMKILYHNRNRRKEDEELAVSACYCAKIEDLLQHSDFVMLVVNLTPQTYKLIGKRELELMKPTATLINISRGSVVDQDALVEALQSSVIKGAALDVTDPEPLPRDHPLLKLRNVIITPHLGSRTHKTTRMITEEAIDNILAALRGLPMPSEVFPD
ncbi:putative 2-ketogluconate reductase isoform X3 [Paroedura picta]|uniref:putative 2-ketogluconate reductase isoform X3 n=1 Tax=Paroedura picta TaxID=143630 RepID=UPI0040575174